jgi:hypothetical protein
MEMKSFLPVHVTGVREERSWKMVNQPIPANYICIIIAMY